MAGKVVPAQPATSFEYELFEGDYDRLRTVVASSNQSTPWIDPENLKLRHRIGRGPFGDVWLATHHHSTEDYDEYHEVALKMLHPVKEDHVRVLLDKFDDLFLKCGGIEGVCLIRGISIINGKICIIMRFYEGSIGDKMARRKGGKISLADVLRYGIELAQGVLELHAKDLLVLNLKSSNFLLNENDQAILGDVGIPYLLLGIPLRSSDMSYMLGTPNYMAPEQWQPEVRGPLSAETDSWGFACGVVEMLTGIQPWSGRSVEEIYDLVVRKQEKPRIPEGLPPPVENVLHSCFEYDFRNRPLMKDILRIFKSSQNAVYGDGGWRELGSRTILDKSGGTGYSKWFLLKDHLQVGDTVRSRKPLNSSKSENMDVPEAIVVGLERDADQDGFLLVRVLGIHDPLRVPILTLERVTFGLAAGDWVRLKEENKRHSPVGILHSINRDGSVAVGFIGVETFWKGNSSELQMAKSYFVGQFVRLKAKILSPRFEWPRKRQGAWATGKIRHILPNGCLVVNFPGRLTFGEEHNTFLADPGEVEEVSFNTCPGMVKKYQHLEDIHWAVRPLLIALGLFTAMKVGVFVGKKMGRSKGRKLESNVVQNDDQPMAGPSSGHSGQAWFPPSVANILGVTTAAAPPR
ncbi:E3 ubiquitin-protein ligase KEG isoform X2 [Ricinus communis]|uniref:Protein kinase, putative n=2 Tax=Ricinus communis TaxID=3988 RepID=B9RP30_RICCO|nr:E3 ubiquitin-protein ligase KEG isoform X2 [Ricinus communis]XP_015572563.1 E3 ubiquitin-protein ligase KEG isoform X2 [Ricinus communis]XP_015572566.1 E3 ubiquitin-protein ligase KEG isoform X2 [Ricinus communis]EEF46948.1 protein kinase, putative [Ricinus communis]|eukprot:XP_002515499.1 E3 ubiquitin-protein ligase KEG isoform X2 [Ricinus communis]